MNKKSFIVLVLTFIMSTDLCLGKGEIEKEKGYNILFIMNDQHRGDYIGVSGNSWIYTPNIDCLANNGLLFNRGYTSQPSCLPARAALLTGKSPWEHGMLMYTDIPAKSYRHEMPQMMRDNGYYTISVGKNHFINAPLKEPEIVTHGYEEMHMEEGWRSIYKGVDPRNCDYANWFHTVAPQKDMNATKLSYTDHRGGRYFMYADSLHPTNWTADQAIKFLKNYKGQKPWFMKVSFQRPHPPFDPPRRWIDYYEDKNIPEPNVGAWAEERYKSLRPDSLEYNGSRRFGKYTRTEIISARIAYAAAISHVDEQLGRVIKALEEQGELENTFILFTSDHGDMMGDHYMWAKCRPYEPSVRVPFIVRWPDKMNLRMKRGKVSDKLVELRDVLPTFLDVAGITQPCDMDGLSIVHLLRKEGKWREILDLEHGQIYEKDNAWVALTNGRYKYVYFTLTGQQQLFDLKIDPHEKVDISIDPGNNKLLALWRKRMVDHLSKRGAPWVKEGDLNIQEKTIYWRPGYPEALQ